MALEERHEDYLNSLFDAGAEATVEGGRDCFNEWERDFLEDIHSKYEEYEAGVYISTKQWAILFRIGEHLGVSDPR